MKKIILSVFSTLFFYQNIAFSCDRSIEGETLINGESINQKKMIDILRLVPKDQIGVSINLLNPVFESSSRQIKDQHKYGQSFPCNPEMLHDLMLQAPGKRVLEIAGASGENALLLGLAGAEHVYMNDIVPAEVEDFQTKLQTLSPELQEHFTPLLGNCFDLKDSITAHSIDIILARNIFHFLKPSQYQEFFTLIKDLLKPGGLFAMTVNSRYAAHTHPIEAFEGTSFSSFLFIFDENYRTPRALERIISVCEDETKDPIEYTNHEVSDGHRTDQNVLSRLPKKIRQKAKGYISQFKKFHGKIRVLENTTMMFTPDNLSHLIEQNGLETLSTHHINKDGHYVSEETAMNGASFVGLMAQMPTY